jgi:hypothetical protein
MDHSNTTQPLKHASINLIVSNTSLCGMREGREGGEERERDSRF